jgi:hypothetical protein
MPVPLTLTVCGLRETLSVTVTSAVRVPVAVGRKVTVIVQLAPAAIVDPQFVVCEKSEGFVPASVMLEMSKLELPTFVTIFVCAALVVPTAWLPKVTTAGLIESPDGEAVSAVALVPAPPPQDDAKKATARQAVANIIASPHSGLSFPVLIKYVAPHC